LSADLAGWKVKVSHPEPRHGKHCFVRIPILDGRIIHAGIAVQRAFLPSCSRLFPAPALAAKHSHSSRRVGSSDSHPGALLSHVRKSKELIRQWQRIRVPQPTYCILKITASSLRKRSLKPWRGTIRIIPLQKPRIRTPKRTKLPRNRSPESCGRGGSRRRIRLDPTFELNDTVHAVQILAVRRHGRPTAGVAPHWLQGRPASRAMAPPCQAAVDRPGARMKQMAQKTRASQPSSKTPGKNNDRREHWSVGERQTTGADRGHSSAECGYPARVLVR